MEEKIFAAAEAEGLFDIVKNYLMRIPGDLPAKERAALGRLLSEIQYTLEANDDDPPANVRPIR